MARFRILEHWKRRPGDGFEYRKVKKGWDTLGEIRKYPSGHIIYWAKCKPDDIHTKTNSWAFDVETISALKAYRVPYIGVLVASLSYIGVLEASRRNRSQPCIGGLEASLSHVGVLVASLSYIGVLEASGCERPAKQRRPRRRKPLHFRAPAPLLPRRFS